MPALRWIWSWMISAQKDSVVHCAVGFVKQKDDCTKCPQGASIGIAALPMIISLVILLAGLLVAFLCGKKVENHAEDSGSKWFGQAKVSYSFSYK